MRNTQISSEPQTPRTTERNYRTNGTQSQNLQNRKRRVIKFTQPTNTKEYALCWSIGWCGKTHKKMFNLSWNKLWEKCARTGFSYLLSLLLKSFVAPESIYHKSGLVNWDRNEKNCYEKMSILSLMSSFFFQIIADNSKKYILLTLELYWPFIDICCVSSSPWLWSLGFQCL